MGRGGTARHARVLSMARLPALSLAALMVLSALVPAAVTAAVVAQPVAAAPASDWAPSSYSAAEEQHLTALTNQARAGGGRRALSVDPALTSLARWRSADMATRGYFSHEIPPTGQMVFATMRARNMPFVLAGENIGWTDASPGEATAQIERMFLASKDHRANIMGATWDRIGVGAYRAASGRVYYTVLFEQTHPTLKASAAVPSSAANGTRVTLSATVTGGVAPYRYGWYANGTWLAGGRTVRVSTLVPGPVKVGLVIVDSAGAVSRVSRTLVVRP